MNIAELSDNLKGVPDDYLIKHAQQPDGTVPQFMALSELQRRQDMRQRFAANPPTTTVADDILASQSANPVNPTVPLPNIGVPNGGGPGLQPGNGLQPNSGGIAAGVPKGYATGGSIWGDEDWNHYTPRIQSFEGQNSYTSQNPHSSARGAYQFTRGTYKIYAKKAGVDPDDWSPEAQDKVFKAFTEDNLDTLKKNDLTPTATNAYTTHFLGGTGGVNFLKALERDPDAPVSEHFSQKIRDTNPAIFKKAKTLGDVYGKMQEVGGNAPSTMQAKQRDSSYLDEALGIANPKITEGDHLAQMLTPNAPSTGAQPITKPKDDRNFLERLLISNAYGAGPSDGGRPGGITADQSAREMAATAGEEPNVIPDWLGRNITGFDPKPTPQLRHFKTRADAEADPAYQRALSRWEERNPQGEATQRTYGMDAMTSPTGSTAIPQSQTAYWKRQKEQAKPESPNPGIAGMIAGAVPYVASNPILGPMVGVPAAIAAGANKLSGMSREDLAAATYPIRDAMGGGGISARDEAAKIATHAATTAPEIDGYAKELADLYKSQITSKEDMRSMALLQAGLGIAAGESPYFATNVGRGAQAGIESWNAAQKGNQEATSNYAQLLQRQAEVSAAGRRADRGLDIQQQQANTSSDRALAYAEKMSRTGTGQNKWEAQRLLAHHNLIDKILVSGVDEQGMPLTPEREKKLEDDLNDTKGKLRNFMESSSSDDGGIIDYSDSANGGIE